MNAHALLSSQGWRGKGHSLHKTDDSIGLAKPLLLARKDNTKGLGTNQHFTSDQWWMNAFDEQLQGLDTSKKGRVIQTVQTGKLNTIEKGPLGKWQLYTSFVKGGLLQGTLFKTEEKDTSTESESDEDSDASTPEPTAEEPEVKKETKEERRARREARRQRKEREALEKAARRERRSKSKKSDSSDDAKTEKRRRRAKKEEKRRRREQKENRKKET